MKSPSALSILVLNFFLKLSLASNPNVSSGNGILRYTSQDEAEPKNYVKCKKNFNRRISFSADTKPGSTSEKKVLISPKNIDDRNYIVSSPTFGEPTSTDSESSFTSSSLSSSEHVVRELCPESSSPSFDEDSETSSSNLSLNDPTGIWSLIFDQKQVETRKLLKEGDQLQNKSVHLKNLLKDNKYANMIRFLGKNRRSVLNEQLEGVLTALDFALKYEQDDNINVVLESQDDISSALNKVFKYAKSHPNYKLSRFFLDNCSAYQAYRFIGDLQESVSASNSSRNYKLYSACVSQLDLSYAHEITGETLLHRAIRRSDFDLIYWIMKRSDSEKYFNIPTRSDAKMLPLEYAMKYTNSTSLIENYFKNHTSLLDAILLKCNPEAGIVALESFKIVDESTGSKWLNLFSKLLNIHFTMHELLPTVETIFVTAVKSGNQFEVEFLFSEFKELLPNLADMKENQIKNLIATEEFMKGQFSDYLLGKRSNEEVEHIGGKKIRKN